MSEEMAQAQEVATEGSTTEATTNPDAPTEVEHIKSYADGKFKGADADKVLEKSYMELVRSYSQKLGKFDGAPEEYTLNEGFESNPITEALTSWGKENQLNNDGLNGMLEVMNQVQENDAKAYRESQLAELGKDADARIKNASDWALANLGEEAVAGINSMWVGAKGIEAIEKIMKLAQGTAPAAVPAKPSFDADQVRAMRFAEDEYGNRKMSTDKAYRQKVLEAEAALNGSSSGYIV